MARPLVPLLLPTEAAEQLGVTARYLRTMREAGRIGFVRLPGGQVRYRPAEVARIAAERAEGSE